MIFFLIKVCYIQNMKIVSAFVSLTIFLWILPLGNFIKPSQEKVVCDGQRAFHMCSMGNLVDSESEDSRVKFTNPGNVTEKAKTSGSAGTQLLPQNVLNFFPPSGFEFMETNNKFYYPHHSFPIDHPPQNTLF